MCFDNLCLFRIGQAMWPVRCLTNSFKGAWFYVWVYKAWCSRRSHFLAQFLCCNLNLERAKLFLYDYGAFRSTSRDQQSRHSSLTFSTWPVLLRVNMSLKNPPKVLTSVELEGIRGGSSIFSQGGSGSQCHRDAAGVSVEGMEGGLGGLPQENFEYEVL